MSLKSTKKYIKLFKVIVTDIKLFFDSRSSKKNWTGIQHSLNLSKLSPVHHTVSI